MEKATLKEKLDKIEKVARLNYANDGKLVLCFYVFLVDKEGDLSTATVPITLPGMVTQRSKSLEILGKQISRLELGDVEGIGMIAECWATITAIEDEQDIISGKLKLKTSKEPEKREAVLVAGMTASGDMEIRGYYIENKEISTSTFLPSKGEARLLDSFWKGYYGLKGPSD